MYSFEKAQKSDYIDIRRLYLSAFPPEERPPFILIRRTALSGRSDMFTVRKNGEFAGFANVIAEGKLAYLFFLAIEEDFRSQGAGSFMLSALKNHYSGARLFLAREVLDTSAENALQREARFRFYCRNGFRDIPVYIEEGGCRFETMAIGGMVAPREYARLMHRWSPLCSGLLRTKMIRREEI